MPLLVQRELQSRALSIDKTKQIFSECIRQWHTEQNLFFSPEVKYPQVFINPRVKYMTEVLRQLSHSYKRIVAVVDNDLIPAFEEHWES
jgi:pheromone shutdown protein TraB